jgi:hypothetical protein
MLGQEGNAADASWSLVEEPLVVGRKIQRSDVLFPKPVSV